MILVIAVDSDEGDWLSRWGGGRGIQPDQVPKTTRVMHEAEQATRLHTPHRVPADGPVPRYASKMLGGSLQGDRDPRGLQAVSDDAPAASAIELSCFVHTWSARQ